MRNPSKHEIERYACPRCGARCFVATRCLRCGQMMIDRARLPDWEASRDTTAYPSPIWWTVAAAFAFMLLEWAALALFHAASAQNLLAFAYFLALPVAGRLGPIVSRAVAHRSLAAAAARRIEATTLTPIRAAPDGASARIRGTARIIRSAPHPTRRDCVAFHQDGRTLERAGGEFEVCDDSGVRAIVKAEHVVVENASLVADGAAVEIVGDAHWVAEQDDLATHGNVRDAARCLVLTGTQEHPIVIRVRRAGEEVPTKTTAHARDEAISARDVRVDPSEAAAAPTGVRVAPRESDDGRSGELRDDEAGDRVAPPSRSRSGRTP